MPERTHPFIAICAIALGGEDAIQLLPAGPFRAVDGRPADAASWTLDATSAAALIAAAKATDTDLVIDYDHQTLRAVDNGQPAPAAGWIDTASLEWRDGDGLWAKVKWTVAAVERIANGEYRYFSPVFTYDRESGAVLQILHGGLTNVPALDELAELQARAAAHYQHPEELAVNDEQLKALGLQPGATEQQITDAIAALNARSAIADTALTALSLPLDKSDVDVEGAIAALTQTAAGTVDPAKYVPIETVSELRKSLQEVQAALSKRDIDEVVLAALSDGRLLPAQEKWARDLGESNLAALRSYIDTTQPIAALNGNQTGGKPPANDQNPAGLTDGQLAVCQNMGLDPEDYAKRLSEDAA